MVCISTSDCVTVKNRENSSFFQLSTDPKYPVWFLAARQKRMLNLNAFDFDINECLFWRWTTYGVGKGKAVLNYNVNCKDKEDRLQGLCYGTPWPKDQMQRKEHSLPFVTTSTHLFRNLPGTCLNRVSQKGQTRIMNFTLILLLEVSNSTN